MKGRLDSYSVCSSADDECLCWLFLNKIAIWLNGTGATWFVIGKETINYRIVSECVTIIGEL